MPEYATEQELRRVDRQKSNLREGGSGDDTGRRWPHLLQLSRSMFALLKSLLNNGSVWPVLM